MSWAEVKKINADMNTSLDVNIGQRTEAAATTVGTATSLMGYVKGIFNHLLNQLSSARMAKIDSISTSVSNVSTTVGTMNTTMGTINSTLATVNATTARGVVKSVQRGTFKLPDNYANGTITLSTINAAKALVILNNGVVSYQVQAGIVENSGARAIYGSIVVALTNTALTVSTNNTSSGSSGGSTISWQVIEFY